MLKLVIHDADHAAGLYLARVGAVRQLIAELKALKDTPSASLFMEALAERCLERGWSFTPADPLVRGCASRLHIVEVHLDPTRPGTPFVALYEPGDDGHPRRRLHDTLEGLAGRLRLPQGFATPVRPAVEAGTLTA
ncbi:hypothetical protein [Azospirillum sp. sgz302134]